MNRLTKRNFYVAPQSEIIEFQLEANFLGSTSSRSYSTSARIQDSGVEDGGDI